MPTSNYLKPQFSFCFILQNISFPPSENTSFGPGCRSCGAPRLGGVVAPRCAPGRAAWGRRGAAGPRALPLPLSSQPRSCRRAVPGTWRWPFVLLATPFFFPFASWSRLLPLGFGLDLARSLLLPSPVLTRANLASSCIHFAFCAILCDGFFLFKNFFFFSAQSGHLPNFVIFWVTSQ